MARARRRPDGAPQGVGDPEADKVEEELEASAGALKNVGRWPHGAVAIADLDDDASVHLLHYMLGSRTYTYYTGRNGQHREILTIGAFGVVPPRNRKDVPPLAATEARRMLAQRNRELRLIVLPQDCDWHRAWGGKDCGGKYYVTLPDGQRIATCPYVTCRRHANPKTPHMSMWVSQHWIAHERNERQIRQFVKSVDGRADVAAWAFYQAGLREQARRLRTDGRLPARRQRPQTLATI